MREWVHEYNHQYWTEQNLRFVEAKRAFVEAHKRHQRIKNEEIKEPTTAEYNEFYKRFLNENYYNHYDYNQKWLRYNFALLWPACKVFLYRLFVKNNRVNKRLKWEIKICLSPFLFLNCYLISSKFKQVVLFECKRFFFYNIIWRLTLNIYVFLQLCST